MAQSRYILISFYEEREGRFLVYGWIHGGHSERINIYTTFIDAVEACFRFGVPVLQSANAQWIAEKLTEESH